VTRIEVDRERCVGSGTCEMLAPEVFEVGDDGIVTVVRPDAGDEPVRDAVQQCPTQALNLTD
jgi:ferredoxin